MSKSIPAIGQAWPDQGGIYIGARLIDGTVYHVVIPGGVEHDTKNVAFKNVETSIPKELNGFSDWRAPDQEDLMLAWINAREHFDKSASSHASHYWSRTMRDGSSWAWCVGFDQGFTSDTPQSYKLRVRPFRRFVY